MGSRSKSYLRWEQTTSTCKYIHYHWYRCCRDNQIAFYFFSELQLPTTQEKSLFIHLVCNGSIEMAPSCQRGSRQPSFPLEIMFLFEPSWVSKTAATFYQFETLKQTSMTPQKEADWSIQRKRKGCSLMFQFRRNHFSKGWYISADTEGDFNPLMAP